MGVCDYRRPWQFRLFEGQPNATAACSRKDVGVPSGLIVDSVGTRADVRSGEMRWRKAPPGCGLRGVRARDPESLRGFEGLTGWQPPTSDHPGTGFYPSRRCR